MQPDKQHFLYLLNNYRSLTEKETVELVTLQKHFPYSQVIRNMTAWGAYHNNLPICKTQLYIATLYATDRKLLKTLITAPRIERNATKIAKKQDAELQKRPDLHPKMVKVAEKPQNTSADLQMMELWEHLPEHLLDLKRSRREFEHVMESFEHETESNHADAHTPSAITDGVRNDYKKKIIKQSQRPSAPKKAIKKVAKKRTKTVKKVAKKAAKKSTKVVKKARSVQKKSPKRVVKKAVSRKKSVQKRITTPKRVAKKVEKKKPKA